MLLENENFMNYETEKNFIMSPYNKSSFYIPGKGITVDEDGNIRFYPLDDINEFVFGQDIEPEFLFDEYLLTLSEKEQIKKLKDINLRLTEKEIVVVYMRYENKELFLFVTTENNPEVFYKISESNLDKITKNDLSNKSPNNLETAIYIEV